MRDADTAEAPAGEVTRGAAPRLYRQAVDVLEDMIRAGTLAPGAPLLETRIAADFGISRAPARQALNALVEGGLVEKAPGKGYVVSAHPARPAALDREERPAGGLRAAVADHAPRRLSSTATWERIYDEVENEITARISFASWRINEAELARHYGVSRTVARDVVGRLQQRGLLTKDDGARWIAPSLTPERLGELYELRSILEPVALEKAAANCAPDHLAAMLRDLDQAIADPAAVDGDVLDRLEEALHVTLLSHCGNAALMEALTMPQSLIVAHRFLYRWTPRLYGSEPFLPEHREIVVHLLAGRVRAAGAALRDHLVVSHERAVTRVASVNRDFAPAELDYMHPLSAG